MREKQTQTLWEIFLPDAGRSERLIVQFLLKSIKNTF